MVIAGDWILHGDNAPAHTALSVRWWKSAFLCFRRLLILQICHLVLFTSSQNQTRVKGYHFQTLDSVQKAVADAIKSLTEADCQSCYEAWKIRWANCVTSEGYCFEGDIVDSDE
jgi:hypothetical protein